MLERFYLIYNVLITLRFLTLCASVGNKGGFRSGEFKLTFAVLIALNYMHFPKQQQTLQF